MATATLTNAIATDLGVTLHFSESRNGYDFYAMLDAQNEWSTHFVAVPQGADENTVINALYSGQLVQG